MIKTLSLSLQKLNKFFSPLPVFSKTITLLFCTCLPVGRLSDGFAA